MGQKSVFSLAWAILAITTSCNISMGLKLVMIPTQGGWLEEKMQFDCGIALLVLTLLREGAALFLGYESYESPPTSDDLTPDCNNFEALHSVVYGPWMILGKNQPTNWAVAGAKPDNIGASLLGYLLLQQLPALIVYGLLVSVR